MNAYYYCPYLGKEGDSETAIGFAHSSNRCYAGKIPLAVKNDYQERYCLNPNHQSCTVFQQNPVSLPGNVELPPARQPSVQPEPIESLNPSTKPKSNVEMTQPVATTNGQPTEISEDTAEQIINLKRPQENDKRKPQAPPPQEKPTSIQSAQQTQQEAPQEIILPPKREARPPVEQSHRSPESSGQADEKPAEQQEIILPPKKAPQPSGRATTAPSSPVGQAPSPRAEEIPPVQEPVRQKQPTGGGEKPQSTPKKDLYEPGSISPPKPIDGGGRKTPPRPRKIPGLEGYGPQSYGPQSYGPQSYGPQQSYGPRNTNAENGSKENRPKSPSKKAKRAKNDRSNPRSRREDSNHGGHGTQPVAVRGMAPSTSPRKRLNWLTILEVLMGIVVLGGIVLVIWLMISLIPGAGGLNYTVPANASTTREVTATVPEATATEEVTATTVITNTPFPTMTPTEVTPTPAPTATPEMTDTPQASASPNTTATAAAAACEYPKDWAPYTVQSGDVLINLAEFFGLTLEDLQKGNCMDDGTLIYPGDVIYLPEINENTSEPTPTEEP